MGHKAGGDETAMAHLTEAVDKCPAQRRKLLQGLQWAAARHMHLRLQQEVSGGRQDRAYHDGDVAGVSIDS
jgi:hypothetical protein